MTPAIILDRQGRLVGAVGSPGGTAILAYVGKALVGTIDWGLPMQEAINLPNLIARGSSYGSRGRPLPRRRRRGPARARHHPSPRPGRGFGLHGVFIRQGILTGGADPRREGVVLIQK
jgi:gamma-glutamyltranspeptidase/glutathione hydrolase